MSTASADKSRVRAAHPEHFFRAVEHGLALLMAGMPTSMLNVMANGCSARGLSDAAEGYMHARLRVASVGDA